MTVTKTICFSDIKDSCGLTEALGHSQFRAVIRDHLDVSRALAGAVRGTYIKNIGDANMVKFDGAIEGLLFAALLQEYCIDRPCVEGTPVAIRVGLHHGEVMEDVLPESSDPDAFGGGVAMAQRVQSAAGPGEVLVTGRVMEFVREEWPAADVSLYFAEAGAFPLKGFGTQDLWRFDWAGYLRDHPDAGIAALLMKQFEEASVVPLSLSAAAIADAGLVIWPIVPRGVVTAIHRGQAEVVRLLARQGWRVRVLIADCGAHEYDARLVARFSDNLTTFLEFRGVTQVDIELLSSVFDPTGANYPEMQARFQRITRELPFEKLLAMNTKSYSENVRDDIKKSPALEFIRPSLIISALSQMAKAERHKTIVVAGRDEEIQYRALMDLPDARDRLGVLMIPVLSEGEPGSPQMRQSVNGPIWDSQAELRDALARGNLAWWAFNLLDFLPMVPRSTVSFARPSKHDVRPSDWATEDENPASLDLAELAEHIWPLLDPQ